MTRSIFGWSYPPGCSGPPDYPEPPEWVMEIWGTLEDNGMSEVFCEKIENLILEEISRIEREEEEIIFSIHEAIAERAWLTDGTYYPHPYDEPEYRWPTPVMICGKQVSCLNDSIRRTP